LLDKIHDEKTTLAAEEAILYRNMQKLIESSLDEGLKRRLVREACVSIINRIPLPSDLDKLMP